MGATADIGFIGLGVMGQNLVLNMDDHGFTVAVYNRTPDRVTLFLDEQGSGRRIIGTSSLAGLLENLKSPRKVMMMIKAGKAVDSTIEQLLNLLEPGDIIIDGGNSFYRDSMRWAETLESRGILFVGCGISGGEEGARRGPSIMPGGSPAAWPHVKNILQAIAAKADGGVPCCDWVGENGAGHFVKMVHNGIEYGDMQLICEAYDLMHTLLGLSNDEISQIFSEWNSGPLNSYLIEITSHILAHKRNGIHTVDTILDAAGQKGTGKWTTVSAIDYGIPLTLIGEALFSRFLSALKEERVAAAQLLAGDSARFAGDRESFVADIGEALLAAKIISYTQGYMLFRTASETHNWKLNFGGIALIWRQGCIIRARFLDKIKEAYARDPHLPALLLDPYFQAEIRRTEAAWRRVVAGAAAHGVPLPAMSSGLAFFDGYRRERLPANLLQAQRDYFGAHTYERIDGQRGDFFHTNWGDSQRLSTERR